MITEAKSLSECIFAEEMDEIALELSYDPSVSEDVSWVSKLETKMLWKICN